MHEKTAEEVYDKLTAEGEYKIAEKDIDIVKKMKLLWKMQNTLNFS
jgi:hypothetical protein